jgi:Ca2+-binding RTX toxin-like protein
VRDHSPNPDFDERRGWRIRTVGPLDSIVMEVSMRRRWSALVVAGMTVTVVGLVQGPASAEPNPTPNYAWTSGGNVIYEAGLSRVNQLVVEAPGGGILRLTDISAIILGPGCTQGATNRVAECQVPPSGSYHVDIYLGSKNDTVAFVGPNAYAWPTVDAGTGDDSVDFGQLGSKVAIAKGGPGNDTLTAPTTNQVVILSLDGQTGADVMCGGPGSRVSYHLRTVAVNVSADGVANDGEPGEGDNVCSTIGMLTGSPYDDSLTAASTGSKIYGGSGNDNLYGKWSNDVLYGDAGDDQLYGASGDDTLTGGPGADHLDGGLGYVDACYTDAFDTEVNCEL